MIRLLSAAPIPITSLLSNRRFECLVHGLVTNDQSTFVALFVISTSFCSRNNKAIYFIIIIIIFLKLY
jgi:hypothetical protein